MKKTLIALIAAVMAFTVVSCGKDEKAAVEETTSETNAETTAETTTYSYEQALDDLLSETTTTAEELEQALNETKELALERIDITAQDIPEYKIPDDWHEVSDGRMKMLVPPGVTDQSPENSSLILSKFVDKENGISVITMNGNDWEEKSKEDIEFFPEVSEENIAAAFNTLGIDYDGTRTSFYKAVLSFTSADRTEENAEAFEIAALAKGFCFLVFPEVFYRSSDGHDIYAHAYPLEGIDDEKYLESNNARFWVGAFADSNTEYTLMVKGSSREEALMICSTIEFIG